MKLRNIVVWAVIVGAGIIISSRLLNSKGSEGGVLSGKIILYPIGSRCADRRQCSREASDQVVEVHRLDGSLAAKTTTNRQGIYSLKLPSGSYNLVVPPARYGRGANNISNPVKVERKTTTAVDVVIDTGIK